MPATFFIALIWAAEPTRDVALLTRLLAEQLPQRPLPAPVLALRLRLREAQPWAGRVEGLLHDGEAPREPLPQALARLAARLGPRQVLRCEPGDDHRPERMLRWRPVFTTMAGAAADPAAALDCGWPSPVRARSERSAAPVRDAARRSDPMPTEWLADTAAQIALWPPWLVQPPLRLAQRGEQPLYGGPLRRLTRVHRIETGWWEGGGPCMRDYFIAESPTAGLVWIYRERHRAAGEDPAVEGAGLRWYLHGLYA